ncbi:unnamed protein product [Leuciscus chuanchicus]
MARELEELTANYTSKFWMKREDGVSEPDNWTKDHPAGEDCASLGHKMGETDFWTDAFCFQEKRFKMKPSVFYGKAERRAKMYRVQVVIPSHESEDKLGISDEEYERQAELGLVDSEDEETDSSLSMKLSAQETKSKLMAIEFKELTVNYNRVEEGLRTKDTMERELEERMANYTRVREQLSFYEAFAAQSLNCNMSLTAWGGKLYVFSSDKLNWTNSRDVCVSKGADLVTITSQSEQDFLVSKVSETHWIGLNDLDTEGHWVWVNNQTLTDTRVQFWHRRQYGPREPDNWKQEDPSGENCASLGNWEGYFNKWFDQSCKEQKKFICEKN